MKHQMRNEAELRDQFDSAIKTDYGYNEEYNTYHETRTIQDDREALAAMLAPILDVLLDIRRALYHDEKEIEDE